jgi:uncharacterized glyoxalase superfamily protein PhnB
MEESAATPAKPRWSTAPYFMVDDVVATANFYRDALGFRYERLWGDPPCFAIVGRNGAHIMLSQIEGSGPMHPNRVSDPDGAAWDAYIWIDNAEALHDEYVQKGVTIPQQLRDQEYGCREFTIRDCNGFTIGFGQNLA